MEYTMKYSQYKQHYPDCKTVPGTYDKTRRTVKVIIPDGRMKPSGVRGETFKTIFLRVGNTPGKMFQQGFRAVSYANAVKQAKKQYAYVEDEERSFL